MAEDHLNLKTIENISVNLDKQNKTPYYKNINRFLILLGTFLKRLNFDVDIQCTLKR